MTDVAKADEVKAPTQEEKDAVLFDLVMERRKATHLGNGIYVNHEGRAVDVDEDGNAVEKKSAADVAAAKTSAPSSPPPTPIGTKTADGSFEWNGATWVPVGVS